MTRHLPERIDTHFAWLRATCRHLTPLRKLAAISFAIAFTATSAAAKEFSKFQVGVWQAGAYTNDKSGEFSHCSASAFYKHNGVTLFVFVDKSYSLDLTFFQENWQLNENKLYSLRYRYDGGRWEETEAYPVDKNAFAISMSKSPAGITSFRKAQVLELMVGTKSFYFGLLGTSNLVSSLAQCVTKYSKDTRSPKASADNNNVGSNNTDATTPGNNTPKTEESGSGTGIVVTDVGHILTNNHVIDGCSRLAVVFENDSPRVAHLIKADKTNDLAVVRADTTPTSITPAQFSNQTVRAGQNITVFGFPLKGTLSSSGNVVSGNITALSGMNDDARLFQISAPIQPGNSGGPLLNMEGSVIGVVTSKLDELVAASKIGTLPQNVNFAIKSDIAKSFLQAHSISYAVHSPSSDLPATDVVDIARKFTVQVLCNP
jgi:S1-C subfamily serine protease